MIRRSLSRDEVRDIDRRAIDEFGLPGVVLMENAGRGTAELLVTLGVGGTVVVCAGKGNNGGDGFVIARHLENRGYSVKVLLFCNPKNLTGDAAIHFRVIEAAGTPLRILGGAPLPDDWAAELATDGWIVDALLGTGARGEVREPLVGVIREICKSPARVLAVDLPSGMDCDTGRPLGVCVRADHTATLVARKKGFDEPAASEWTGVVHVVDIGVPRTMLEQ
jgi:NAD(P)H-hydrate epimerase